MREIHTLRELKVVIKDFECYILDKFLDEKILCHPVEKCVFMPTGLMVIQEKRYSQLTAGQLFAISTDKKKWMYKKDAMIDIVESGRDCYLINFTLDTIMKVEPYMVNEVHRTLMEPLKKIAGIYDFLWKETLAGNYTSYTFDEYFFEKKPKE